MDTTLLRRRPVGAPQDASSNPPRRFLAAFRPPLSPTRTRGFWTLPAGIASAGTRWSSASREASAKPRRANDLLGAPLPLRRVPQPEKLQQSHRPSPVGAPDGQPARICRARNGRLAGRGDSRAGRHRGSGSGSRDSDRRKPSRRVWQSRTNRGSQGRTGGGLAQLRFCGLKRR